MKLHHEYQHIISTVKPKSRPSNLSPTEKLAIKSLRQKPNIYLPSDYGGEFCIISNEKYNEAALDHLNDPTTYRNIPRMTAKTVETKVNSKWKEICQRRHIPKNVQRSYLSSNTNLLRFYHLIKTATDQPSGFPSSLLSYFNLVLKISLLIWRRVLSLFSMHIPATY